MPGIFAQTIVVRRGDDGDRHDRRHQQGDHRPLPVAADGALGGAHRPDVVGRRLQRRHPRRADADRLRGRLDRSTTAFRAPRGLRAAAAVRLRDGLARRLARAEGADGRGRPSRSSSRCIFPITFISNVFVPIATLPTWLQPIAEWNPTSTLTLEPASCGATPNPPARQPGVHGADPRDAHLGRGHHRDLRAARRPPLPLDEPLSRRYRPRRLPSSGHAARPRAPGRRSGPRAARPAAGPAAAAGRRSAAGRSGCTRSACGRWRFPRGPPGRGAVPRPDPAHRLPGAVRRRARAAVADRRAWAGPRPGRRAAASRRSRR